MGTHDYVGVHSYATKSTKSTKSNLTMNTERNYILTNILFLTITDHFE